MIRCIAIDDEQLALDLISDNIGKVPFLQLEGLCHNAIEAVAALQEKQADLIFLDIRMPAISGLQFLKTLVKKPAVIITSAYAKYALDGFDLDVVDYLLKPYSFERFLKAVTKAADYLALTGMAENMPRVNAEIVQSYIFVKSDYRLVRINFDDILYIEGLKDYVKFFLPDRTVVTQMSIKSLEEKLPARQFIRIHRSFIVAFDKIDSIRKQSITLANREIPVGDQYRDNLFNLISSDQPPYPYVS